jgi:hypothetical protein
MAVTQSHLQSNKCNQVVIMHWQDSPKINIKKIGAMFILRAISPNSKGQLH